MAVDNNDDCAAERLQITRLTTQRDDLLRVCGALWNDRDADPKDPKAVKRLYKAWLDMGDILRKYLQEVKEEDLIPL